MSPAETKTKRKKKGLERLTATVEAVERPSGDLVLARLTRPGGEDYEFKAGQFLYVFLPDSDQKKPYSIASAPYEEDRLDLCVKKVEGGPLSTYIYGLEEGDEVTITRAYGGFVDKTPEDAVYVGLCTGTGVAPIRSMVRQRIHDGKRNEMWVFLGSATQPNLPYHEEWMALDEMIDHLEYVPACTREGMDWKGERGWVQEPFMKYFLKRTDLHAYICGVKRMVDDISQLLVEEMGIDAKQVHKEKYV